MYASRSEKMRKQEMYAQRGNLAFVFLHLSLRRACFQPTSSPHLPLNKTSFETEKRRGISPLKICFEQYNSLEYWNVDRHGEILIQFAWTEEMWQCEENKSKYLDNMKKKKIYQSKIFRNPNYVD